MTTLPRPLRGIIPPLATPLLDRDTLDQPGTSRLVERCLAGGVKGLFVLGTTGEGPGLSYRLRAGLIEHVCHVAAGRVPVLAGIIETSIVESLALAKQAQAAGASAVVLGPPFYFQLSQAETLGYVARFAGESPLPVYLYNIPSLTKVKFEPETVRAAADIPNVYGIKDSSFDMPGMRKMIELLRDRPEFTVMCGPEEHLAEALDMGAHGGVVGGSNLAPSLYVELYEAWHAGKHEQVAHLHTTVMQISDRIYNTTSDGSSYLRGMKAALSVLGLCRNVLAEPYQPFGPPELAQIQQAIADLGLDRESA